MSEDTWVSCVVALGTNLGDRHDIAFRALAVTDYGVITVTLRYVTVKSRITVVTGQLWSGHITWDSI